jgi:uncharacterized membrane protein YuzA (DUF378 family)
MDLHAILGYAHEFAFLLGVFTLSFVIALWWGRQTVINIICALYFSLLLFSNFPYLDKILGEGHRASSNALITIGVFGLFAGICWLIMNRVMPREYLEGKFESFPKKVLLAAALTTLLIFICYTVLPLNTFLTPQPELLSLFTKEHLEFWWLVIPLVVIAIN